MHRHQPADGDDASTTPHSPPKTIQKQVAKSHSGIDGGIDEMERMDKLFGEVDLVAVGEEDMQEQRGGATVPGTESPNSDKVSATYHELVKSG